jgi:putative aldouronate transport system permease protein
MAQTATVHSTIHLSRKQKLKKLTQYLPLFLMTLPGFAYLFINNYLPIYGIQIAFRTVDYSKGVFNGDWIGLDNFKYLFKTHDAFVITRNTILYNMMFIILNTTISIAVAIMLNEIKNKALLKFNQTVILLPHLISMVIIGYLAFAALSIDNGFLNKSIIPMFGMQPISWYTEPKY